MAQNNNVNQLQTATADICRGWVTRIEAGIYDEEDGMELKIIKRHMRHWNPIDYSPLKTEKLPIDRFQEGLSAQCRFNTGYAFQACYPIKMQHPLN